MAIAAILCFFPVLVNTLRGLTSVRPDSIELMRSYAASQVEVFRRVRIPTALPFVFAGLKVATVLAMIGAIVGDYFGGSTLALGVQIENSISLFDFPFGWAAIVVASAFGIAFYLAVGAGGAARAARGPIDTRVTIVHNRAAGQAHDEGGSMRRKHWAWLGLMAVVAATAAATLLSTTAGASPKLTKVTLQLKWVTQAQFAGYYAAAAQGYYKQAGLDVKIKVGGPNITPERSSSAAARTSASTGCRTCSRRARRAAASSRSRRCSPRSGMTELTWKSSGINTIKKMAGKKVGVWCCGNQPELFAALNKNGIDPSNSKRRDDLQPAVRHERLPQPADRRGRGDDLQRAGAGARDEEPEDRASSTRSPT